MHTTAIKCIIRYLKVICTTFIMISPLNEFRVDCYVDADFVGLWQVEDEQYHIYEKSRSGHLITFMRSPIQWTSRLQTDISLSTIESGHILLSQAMR